MIVDVSTFVGSYPFRHLRDPSPTLLLGQMDRLGIDEAWVGHLPSFLYRDPAPGNAALEEILEPHAALRPVPAVHPGLPHWADELARCARRAPAVRAYPNYWGLDSAGEEMQALVTTAADHGCPVLLTIQFEDARQRHHIDTVPHLAAAAVRALARLGDGVRLLVTHAERGIVEEVHYGLTPREAERVLWDLSWIWGPPEEHLQHLLDTIGPSRFVLGTGMPLRVPDSAFAKLDLLDLSPDARALIEGGNIASFGA